MVKKTWIRGRKWICDHGGVTFIPSWGNTFILHNIDACLRPVQMSVTISPQNNMEKKNQPQYFITDAYKKLNSFISFLFYFVSFYFFCGTV